MTTDNIPVCPDCDIPMQRRTAKVGQTKGKMFWGCKNYPTCRCTKSYIEPSKKSSSPNKRVHRKPIVHRNCNTPLQNKLRKFLTLAGHEDIDIAYYRRQRYLKWRTKKVKTQQKIRVCCDNSGGISTFEIISVAYRNVIGTKTSTKEANIQKIKDAAKKVLSEDSFNEIFNNWKMCYVCNTLKPPTDWTYRKSWCDNCWENRQDERENDGRL